ncbi:MAG: hypothetical protein ACREQ7_19625 [Candidatus Binatia bacterium]
MKIKSKAFFIALSFLAQLYFTPNSHAEPALSLNAARLPEIFSSGGLPEKHRLIPVSFVRLFMRRTLVGGLAAYDDAKTTRPADYLELYNSAGDLVAIAWFDRFGIERVAVDRGLLEDAEELQGVFVVLVDGDSV